MSDLMWGLVGALDLLVLALILNISWFAWLAVFHDGSPVVLSAAWIPLSYGIATGHWGITAAAGLLAGLHLGMVVPRFVKTAAPEWSASAPRLRIAAANVYIGNRTPAAAAAQLIGTRADVIVVTERNDTFMQNFDLADADSAYEFRVDEPTGRSDYALAIAARSPLLADSRVVNLGTMRAAQAVIRCGDHGLTVLGVHLAAVTDARGFRTWREEIRELARYLATLEPPFIVIGDFNATPFRPAFRRLIRSAQLTEGHDAVGRGLSRSLKLAARGRLAHLPAFARVDHALLSSGVHAVELINLPAAGSDHHPFVITVAVEPAGSTAAEDSQ